MNSNFDKKILEVYEKFENGEISGDEANLSIQLYTEMKSKEEYRRQKLFGGKDKSNPYFDVSHDKKDNKLYKSNDKERPFDIRLDKRNSNADVERKYAGQNGKIPSTHKNTILVNSDDLKHLSAKEIASKISHERGHQLHNKMIFNSDGSKPIDLPSGVEDKIKEALKGFKLSLDKHLSPDELRADYNSVKRVGAKATISALEKDRKRMHRLISADKSTKTHSEVDKDIDIRIKFIKSLKDIH